MQNNLIIEQNRLQGLRTNHVLHLLLSIITVGLWVFVWILVGVNTTFERARCERRIKILTESLR